MISFGEPQFLLLQPVDEHDLDGLEREAALIAEMNIPFALAAFKIEDWNRELSPWDAPPAFGSQGFGRDAPRTLAFAERVLLPEVIERWKLPEHIPVILGGYSLAALFALWSAYQTDTFSAIAAASPSVWFPGWMEYAERHIPKTRCIYLSLGDREEKTKNRVMSTVGDRIRAQYELLGSQGIATALEWNEGNHFRDSDVRCAKGFAWCVDSILHRKRTEDDSANE
ncbi:MAG: esterase [Oscillibacter sp.]|nr:esterase [Oscillibacter sp.]